MPRFNVFKLFKGSARGTQNQPPDDDYAYGLPGGDDGQRGARRLVKRSKADMDRVKMMPVLTPVTDRRPIEEWSDDGQGPFPDAAYEEDEGRDEQYDNPPGPIFSSHAGSHHSRARMDDSERPIPSGAGEIYPSTRGGLTRSSRIREPHPRSGLGLSVFSADHHGYPEFHEQYAADYHSRNHALPPSTGGPIPVVQRDEFGSRILEQFSDQTPETPDSLSSHETLKNTPPSPLDAAHGGQHPSTTGRHHEVNHQGPPRRYETDRMKSRHNPPGTVRHGGHLPVTGRNTEPNPRDHQEKGRVGSNHQWPGGGGRDDDDPSAANHHPELNRSNLREHHQVDRAGVNHMAPGTASRINAEQSHAGTREHQDADNWHQSHHVPPSRTPNHQPHTVDERHGSDGARPPHVPNHALPPTVATVSTVGESVTDDNRPHDTGRARRRDRSDFDVNGDLEEYMHRTPSGYIYYVIPAGINVIFQDEDGNEITRVGDFGERRSKNRRSEGRRTRDRTSHAHPSLRVQDEHGQVIYQNAVEGGSGTRHSHPQAASDIALNVVHINSRGHRKSPRRTSDSSHTSGSSSPTIVFNGRAREMQSPIEPGSSLDSNGLHDATASEMRRPAVLTGEVREILDGGVRVLYI